MSEVPEHVRGLADAAARTLRERAASFRPDEELAASIAANEVAGDAFAHAYAALRDLGLTDKVLDRFWIETATITEMREAADLLEQLARSNVPLVKRRTSKMDGRFIFESIGTVFFALVMALVPVAVGAFFVFVGVQHFQAWQHDREFPPPKIVRKVEAPLVITQLAPVSAGFERTEAGLIVPARPRDYVTDRAGVLSGEEARLLNAKLARFDRETSNQVVVFIDHRVPDGTTLEELGSASIRQWGVGQKGKDNGVIFFVFLDDRKMRIEVGYGLEGVLTDARSRRITSETVKPYFKVKQYAAGIEAGALEIVRIVGGGSDNPRSDEPATVWPFVWSFAIASACAAALFFIARSLVRVLRGHRSLLFGTIGSSSGGSWLSGSWSSSDSGSSSGSSDSGGSFSGGGGDGGGGGASDSW